MTEGDSSRQRILNALKCEEPDRVPFLESVVDEGVALDLLGRSRPPGATANELAMGDDPVLRGILLESAYYDPLELAENLNLDGFGAYLFAWHGGINNEVGGHSMVSGGSIKSRADLKRIHLPDPDDPALYQPYRDFLARYRPSGKALFCFLNLGSDPVILSMGFEHFATSLFDDRALVSDLFDLYCGWYARVADHLSNLDFDFLWFGDDIAFKTQPYISPKIFRQLFVPHFRKVIDQVRKPWIFHSDGNLMPLMDELVGLGMNGLHPLEPGAMDLGVVKQRYGQNLCLCGHISVDTLSRGTPDEVSALTRAAIQTAAPGGGYIAGSSNSIPYYARAENVRAMTTTIQAYGKYPILEG